MDYKTDDDKVLHGRRLFEDAVDHTDEAHAEAHRASRFYHNSQGEGQWDVDDLKYLRENGRPAFTFNIVKPKVDTFQGMYGDAQRLPIVAASRGEDELLAEVVNHVIDEVMEDANHERLAARQLKTGTITGECALSIEVLPSSLGEGWVKVNLYRVMPYELHWDIASIEPDRSDARYVFWDRWLDKEEFEQAYPDHEGLFDQLSKSSDRGSMFDDDGNDWSGTGSESGQFADETNPGGDYDDHGDDRFQKYYYDRQKDKIRVVRWEYLTFGTVYYAHDTRSGNRVEVEEDRVEQLKHAEKMGMPVKVTESEEEMTRVCEFVGSTHLQSYDEAGPFEGFSIVPFCYDICEETGTAYGIVRNLFDPQSELNKGKSLEIEHLAQSVATGTTAEQDQIVDEDQFTSQRRMPGGVAIVKKGALTEGRVVENQPTQPNSAVLARVEGALRLIDETSAIPSAVNMMPGEAQQSGVTVAIRYHKSRQAVTDPFANFEDAQKTIYRKVTQIITKVMPDDQIAEILGNDSKYQIEGGIVYEMGEGPQPQQQQMQPGMDPSMMQQQETQPVPVAQADLKNVRNMKWRLDMEFTTENSTLRMLQFDTLLQMITAGVPVDPEVIVDYAISSKAARDKLMAYVEQSKKAEAEGAEQQAQALKEQHDGFMQIEAGKVQESQRHNTATEQQALQDSEIKERLEMIDLYLDADENEKARMFDQAKFAVEQRANAQQNMTGA